MKLGRNEPCSCGSGKKFKKCCGRPVELHPAHLIDQQLVPQMRRYCSQQFPVDLLQQLSDEGESEMSLLVPMELYHHRFDGVCVAEAFLRDRGSELGAESRRLLECRIRTVPSIWVVRQVEPSKGLHLEDKLTGEQCFVHEVSGSRGVRAGVWLLARVLDTGAGSVLDGSHSRPLTPEYGLMVLNRFRAAFDIAPGGTVPHDVLARDKAAWGLLEMWETAVDAMDSRPLPTLQNTEGHALLFCRDAFDLRPDDRVQVVNDLRSLPYDQSVEDDDGETVIRVARPSSATPREDGTVIARIVVGADRVTVETASLQRAEEISKAVQDRAGALLRHTGRTTTTPEELQRQAKAASVGRRERESDIPAHVKAALVLQYKEKHYATWPDHPLPALDGLTPRQARSLGFSRWQRILRQAPSTIPSMRERLSALLDDIEFREGGLPASERYDFSELRRALGFAMARDMR